jgi:hypothetical protein
MQKENEFWKNVLCVLNEAQRALPDGICFVPLGHVTYNELQAASQKAEQELNETIRAIFRDWLLNDETPCLRRNQLTAHLRMRLAFASEVAQALSTLPSSPGTEQDSRVQSTCHRTALFLVTDCWESQERLWIRRILLPHNRCLVENAQNGHAVLSDSYLT